MASLLRRFSLSLGKEKENHAPAPTTFRLEIDPDKVEEMNKNFTHIDADKFAPELVTDMTWTHFGEKVLDCGCGSGRIGFVHLLPSIYIHDSHLYSVDELESNISHASSIYPHPNCTYAQGDVLSENFPFKFVIFDKIFALHLLQCVRDYKVALRRFFELLRPGGQLGLLFATNFYCSELDKYFSSDPKWGIYFDIGFLKYNGDCDPLEDDFRGLLEHIGFQVSKYRKEEKRYTFASLEKAVHYYMRTSPNVRIIPAEMVDPFELDCLEKMKSLYDIANVEDPLSITYDLIYVVASKPGFPQKEKHHKHRRLRDRFSLP